MTAITPANAHAYQATCLARHIPPFPHQNFRPPKLEARYPFLPNARSLHVKEAMITVDGLFVQMVVLVLLMVKLLLDGV